MTGLQCVLLAGSVQTFMETVKARWVKYVHLIWYRYMSFLYIVYLILFHKFQANVKTLQKIKKTEEKQTEMILGIGQSELNHC